MFPSHVLFWCIFSAFVSRISTKQALCTIKSSCRECIQTASCAWCSQPDFKQPRCFLSSEPSFCTEEYTYNPVNAVSDLQAFSKGADKFGSTQNENVRISPQKVKLRLRINEVYTLEVKYTQAVNYPVDLYYLMDLSKSMEDDKEKLSALGDLLSDSMRNITSNFRLGFGSFVDKVVMPYVSIIPEKLLEPCAGCAAPYGYKNVMPLNQDTHSFDEQVRNAAVSGNLDEPEGGFDAIMQAVVCREEIGWREKARRLLVFSTDAGFHYAGDGKLGGIIKPNDGRCHLDESGMYTHSSLQDYPSISQVNFKVKENSINVIFAVTAQQFSVYSSLSEHIEGSSVGTLAADSGNIVDLVKEQYNKISTSVEMKDNFTSPVEVIFHSTCKGSTEQNTSKCDGLKAEDMVTFTASIKVTSCPKDPKEWNQIFQIYPVGINENVIIDLQMLCDCPCEEDHPHLEKNSQKHCNGFGIFSCGICECEPLHFGQSCECSTEDLRLHGTATVEKPGACRESNTSSEDCSGRGSCVCGQCNCEHEHITGTFCECDNFSCKRHKNLLCAGEDHGKCECGECVCREGWRGPSCDCQTTTDTCIPPGGGKMCGGHGECVCGRCVCDREQEGHSGRFSGPFCDICLNCQGRCAEFKDCVQCQMYKTGPLTVEECASNCTFLPISVQDVEESKTDNENLCRYDENDCQFAYVYYYENDKVVIRAQKERECRKVASALMTLLAVMLSIILIGLITLLLWKLITIMYDRREYARFESERSMAKWDTGENPLYRQATTNFKNPTYVGR